MTDYKDTERFVGANISADLYDKVREIADREERGKLKWAIVKLLMEALEAREIGDAELGAINWESLPHNEGISTEPGAINFVRFDGKPCFYKPTIKK